MAAENVVSARGSSSESLWLELFQSRIYKGTQGRIARQLTCVAIWVSAAFGAWQWYATGWGGVQFQQWFGREAASTLMYVFPGLFLLGLAWFGYRLVNYPKFADFLIAVEAEMNKVTWPSWPELVRSSLVVMFLLAAMTAMMFLFDVVWLTLFKWIGVRI